MNKRLFLSGALLLLLASPAQALTKPATPPVVKTVLAPSLATNFTAGDEVSQAIMAPSGIFLIGTLESTSSPLVTSAPLGGSDGFIAALGPAGRRLWDLRLGTAGDDVATAGYVDATGNIWVTGVSAVTTNGLSTAQALNRLTIWEVSPTGLLLNTFTKDLSEVDIPTSITLKGGSFAIYGISSKAGFPTFSLSLTPSGTISALKSSVTPAAQPRQIIDALSAAYHWQSFVATKAIKGVAGISLHPSSNLLLKFSRKGNRIKGAYLLPGAPISLQYQAGVGIVVLSQGVGTYYLTILHTK